MYYRSLNEELRKLMLHEFEHDIECNNCYHSKRFNDTGVACYIDVMRKNIIEGSDDRLAAELNHLGCFNSHEDRKTKNGIVRSKIPATASQTFAEGEFNRFYARAVCLLAIERNADVVVYRARESENPRPDSESKIGAIIRPDQLLEDLRQNIGMDTALGLPNGPNSGLSVHLGD